MMKAPRLATNPSANFVEAGKGSPLSLSFVLGVSPSSYQIEGAVQSDGRGHGFWDSYCNVAGRIGALLGLVALVRDSIGSRAGW